MTFHNIDPEAYLSGYTGEPYDYAVCFLSLWFFSDPARIERLLALLLNRSDDDDTTGVHDSNGSDSANPYRRVGRPFAHRLLVAEWALQTACPAAFPHVLAALSIANLEARNIEDHTNVCTPVSPAWFRALFVRLGLHAESEVVVEPAEGFKDGMWEVRAVLNSGFEKRIKKVHCQNQRASLAAEAMQQAVRAAVELVDGGLDGVRSMNVWTCCVLLRSSMGSGEHSEGILGGAGLVNGTGKENL